MILIYTAPCVMLCRQIHYEGKWEGVGTGNRDFFGPTSKDDISNCERFYNILCLCIIRDPKTVSFQNWTGRAWAFGLTPLMQLLNILRYSKATVKENCILCSYAGWESTEGLTGSWSIILNYGSGSVSASLLFVKEISEKVQYYLTFYDLLPIWQHIISNGHKKCLGRIRIRIRN
jgi:hypothetical protein